MRGSSLISSLALLLTACGARLPAPPCTPLGEFPGPEDFDRAWLDGRPVLLVSAAERRTGGSTAADGIWLLEWPDASPHKLDLHGRDSCSFAPHGLATAEVEPDRWQLWVVVHHGDDCEGARHSIEHYRLEHDGLHFIERLTGPELSNPNDVDALPDGRLWLSNNPAWEGGKGVARDLLLRRAHGQVLHFDPTLGRFSIAADQLVFPNGVAYVDGQLWVSAAHGKLFRYQLGPDGKTTASIEHRSKPKATLDNLVEAEGALWMTGHPNGLAFLRHAKHPSKPAPTIAYRVAPGSGEIEAVSHWRDGEVDAGSTVWPIDEHLLLAQVFDPGLRVCDRP